MYCMVDGLGVRVEETSTLNKLSRDGSVEIHWVVLLFILPSANLHVYKSSDLNSYPLPCSRGSIYGEEGLLSDKKNKRLHSTMTIFES